MLLHAPSLAISTYQEHKILFLHDWHLRRQNRMYMKFERYLFDVHIVGMSPQAFSLTGFERSDGAEYMQSWLVQAFPKSAR